MLQKLPLNNFEWIKDTLGQFTKVDIQCLLRKKKYFEKYFWWIDKLMNNNAVFGKNYGKFKKT